jgi:uncharacterized membrane protein
MTPNESVARPGVPEHVTQTVETIAKLQARSEETVTRHQRSVETLTSHLGRPLTLYVIVVAAVLWIALNLILPALGAKPPDPPPFSWLQAATSLGALLMATTVLATQNRQQRNAGERALLDLQVNLLAEQKVAKLISLLEELRRDMPDVKNRTDPLAEAMTQSVDPHAVVSALQESLEETTKDDRSSQP